MKFTDLFIKRPVLAIVVSLVILIAGLQSIRSLSVRQYPAQRHCCGADLARFTWEPTRTWSVDSLRRRSSA